MNAIKNFSSIVLFLPLLFCSCEKKVESPGEFELEKSRPTIAPEEIERARVACADYKARVCLASKSEQALSVDCKQADMRIEAVETQAKILGSNSDLDPESYAVVRAQLRKVAKGCIESAGVLPPTQ